MSQAAAFFITGTDAKKCPRYFTDGVSCEVSCYQNGLFVKVLRRIPRKRRADSRAQRLFTTTMVVDPPIESQMYAKK